jgi:peptidoglycan hydrolase-like protein with peptidoglycan-binding domain
MIKIEKRADREKALNNAKNRQLSCLFLASAVGVLGVATEVKANPVLKKGTSGDQVQKLQEKLQSLGYLNEPPTGFFTPETEQALKNFQQAKGIVADGIAGKQTLAILFNASGLRIGSSNSKLPPSNGPLPVPSAPPLGNVPGNRGTKAATLSNNTTKTPNNLVAIRNTTNPVNQTANLGTNKKSYLYSSQMFRRGDRHQGVVLLQQELQKRGFYQGEIDGVYGSTTERAVRNFQKANNISTDGMVGMQTLAYFAR